MDFFSLFVRILVTLVLFALSLDIPLTAGMMILRCPEVSVLSCRQVPPQCRSFRMIYIRHGFLDCPGCLVCADPWPLPQPASENSVASKAKKAESDWGREKGGAREKLRKKRRKKRLKLKRERKRQRRQQKRRRRRRLRRDKQTTSTTSIT